MKDIKKWGEENREAIVRTASIVGMIFSFVEELAKATFFAVLAMGMLLIYNSTPDTTVYQCRIAMHSETFQHGVIAIVILYMGFSMAFRGRMTSPTTIAASGYGSVATGAVSKSPASR